VRAQPAVDEAQQVQLFPLEPVDRKRDDGALAAPSDLAELKLGTAQEPRDRGGDGWVGRVAVRW
jgi:hypothetical protein